MSDYISIKIRAGLDRIARENPAASFAVDTPGLRAAEDRLNAEITNWREWASGEPAVRLAFKAWERELLAANRTQGGLYG